MQELNSISNKSINQPLFPFSFVQRVNH